MTFLDPQFDINEVKMLWPVLAEEIIALRQLNRQVALKSQENILKTQFVQKAEHKVYREYITREYCFFGFISYSYGEETTLLTNRQSITQKNSLQQQTLPQPQKY